MDVFIPVFFFRILKLFLSNREKCKKENQLMERSAPLTKTVECCFLEYGSLWQGFVSQELKQKYCHSIKTSAKCPQELTSRSKSLDRRASVDRAAPRPIRYHFRPTLAFLAPHFHLQMMTAGCQSDAASFAVAPQIPCCRHPPTLRAVEWPVKCTTCR